MLHFIITFVIPGLLILGTALLGGYTLNFQRTTAELEKKLTSATKLSPADLHNEITPPVQELRTLLLFILLVIMFIYGIAFIEWYIALICVALALAGIFIARKLFPKAGSPLYMKEIKKQLHNMQEFYQRKGDTAGKQAVDHILEKLEELL